MHVVAGGSPELHLVNKGLHVGVDAGRVGLQSCMLQVAPHLHLSSLNCSTGGGLYALALGQGVHAVALGVRAACNGPRDEGCMQRILQ